MPNKVGRKKTSLTYFKTKPITPTSTGGVFIHLLPQKRWTKSKKKKTKAQEFILRGLTIILSITCGLRIALISSLTLEKILTSQLLSNLKTHIYLMRRTNEQRSKTKTCSSLVAEAVVCSDRNDIEDARHLTELAVKHEFKDEREQLIKGDVELFKVTFKSMYSKNVKAKIVSRIILDMLMENKDFQKHLEINTFM